MDIERTACLLFDEVRLLEDEKALLENQLKNALAEIARLKKLNNG